MEDKLSKFGFVFLILLVLTTSCAEKNEQMNDEWKIDKKPFLERFEYFNESQKILWKSGQMNNQGEFSGIGPSAYWLKGYVFFDFDLLSKENEINDWVELAPDITDDYILEDVDVQYGEWLFSSVFNAKQVGSKYHGRFYYSPKLKLVYFDVFW